MIELVLALVASTVVVTPTAPWIEPGTALTLFGVLVALVSLIAVFRTGANNRIDAKREGELTRVYARLDIVEETQGVIVRIAVRAIRQIETTGGHFAMTPEESEVLERNRPLGEKQAEREAENG